MIHKSTIFFGVALIVIATFFVETTGRHEDATPKPKRVHTKVGGKSKEKAVDDKIRKLVQKLSKELKKKIKAKLKEENKNKKVVIPKITGIVPLGYKEQVVSGTNYHVKLRVITATKNTIWYAKIYEQPWTNTLRVTEVKGSKKSKNKLYL